MSRDSFARLVAEGAAVPTDGWDFTWFDGRATEQRPTWGYARLLADRLATVESALDLQTGGGEVVGQAQRLPAAMTVTEGWPPNVVAARARLEPRGVRVVEHDGESPLPFDDGSFSLVSSRHPISADWPEIARVLEPDGSYLAQHVGPSSVFELSEFFLGPQPRAAHESRHPDHDVAAARSAGLDVVDLRLERLRMAFFDVAAVVHFLRKVIWIVPGFDAVEQRDRLRDMHDQIERDGKFVAHSSRFLIEARHATTLAE